MSGIVVTYSFLAELKIFLSTVISQGLRKKPFVSCRIAVGRLLRWCHGVRIPLVEKCVNRNKGIRELQKLR